MRQAIPAVLMTLMLGSSSAWAIGSTQCSNAEGSIARVEKEIWGANPVHWLINGEQLEDQSVTVDQTTVKQLSLEISIDDLGEKQVETTVMKISFRNLEGMVTHDFVICKTVAYPHVLD